MKPLAIRKAFLLGWMLAVPFLLFTPRLALSQAAAPGKIDTSDVNFKTEDGWTIQGTLYMPKAATGPVPALVVLNEPGGPNLSQHIHQSGGTISRGVADRIGMAALSIDVRGTGHSFGKKYFEEFSPEERDALQMDIRGAIAFLSAQKGIDPGRIAILAPALTAEYAVREASHNLPQVKALVLITGGLTDKSREYLQTRADLPVLAIASQDEPKADQERAAAAYFASDNKGSRLMFVSDRGAAIFNRPGNIVEHVADWLKANVSALGTESDVSFKTEDGWTLRGHLLIPDGSESKKVPGVVLVHGQNHDGQAWYYLAREIAKSGLAVVYFDRRENGRSTYDKGTPQPDVVTGSPLDVKAAINFMTAQRGVDANRLALIGATALATSVVQASMDDPRIKTIVGLSFYEATAAVKQYIARADVPLFLIASSNDVNADGGSLAEASRELRRLSKSKETELLMYDDGGRGTNIPQIKPELDEMIVRWLNEKLLK